MNAPAVTPQRGDVFYAELRPGIGSEQRGARPVVILQNDIGNRHAPTVIVAPVTSRPRPRLPVHVELDNQAGGAFQGVVLLEQILTIDKRRLLEWVCRLSPESMQRVDAALLSSLGVAEVTV